MSEPTRIKATTKQNARSLRRNMTDAEKLLWLHLRMKQLEGYKFRRQHPLGNYIADFVCLEAALILEVDGGSMQIMSLAMQVELDGWKQRVFGLCDSGITKCWRILKE